MIRTLVALTVAIVLFGCGGAGGENEPGAENAEMTREQRDSAIAESPIPGAGVVGEALEARERANARATAHDTIR